MIRYLRYAFAVVIGIALLTVAMANRTPVSVQAVPDDIGLFLGIDWKFEVPLFLVMFGGIVVGLLIGFFWEWFRERKHRSTASVKSREVARLERELSVMRDASSVPKDDILELLDRPKAR